ncbi:MAG: hypothetical protein ACHBNF_04200 [Chromatiales bacterium]
MGPTRVAREVDLPPRYSVSWSGQYEYLERAAARLQVVVPMTLAMIVRRPISKTAGARRGAACTLRPALLALALALPASAEDCPAAVRFRRSRPALSC